MDLVAQQDFSLFFVFLVPLRVSKNSCSATGDGWKRPPTLPFTHHAHRGTRLYLFFPTNHRSSVYVAYNCCFRPKPTTSFKFLIFNFFFFIQQFYPTLLVVDAFVDNLNLHRFAPYLIFSSIDLHLWLYCIFYCHIRRLTIQRKCVVKNRQFWSKILCFTTLFNILNRLLLILLAQMGWDDKNSIVVFMCAIFYCYSTHCRY